MMACPKATGFSLALAMSIFVFSGSIMVALWVFIILQLFMIVMTDKDPYFMNVRIIALRSKKTKNYQSLKGNCYDA